MNQGLEPAGRAGAVRAAVLHLALRLDDLDAAERAVRRHLPHDGAGPVLSGRTDDLRDHVPRPLHDDEVTFADVLAVDVLLIVQRRAGHGHPADRHRLELGPRVERTCPAHSDMDPVERRDRSRRRPLERPRPPWPLVKGAQPTLLIEGVDLDHDAVDLVVELGTPALPALAGGGDLVDRLESFGVRVRPEPALSQPREHLELRVGRVALVHAGAVDPEREGPLGSDRRIELPQRARRGVAWVRRRFLARSYLRRVEAGEPGEREVDLSANLEELRRYLGVSSAHPQRNRLDRAHVRSHVLAAEPVTAGRRPDEHTTLVDQ